MRRLKLTDLKLVVETYGQPYSETLGIRLNGHDEAELFKWFLASLLFGAPITEAAAIKTYHCFEKKGVTSATKILEAKWEGLVRMLDEGGYTRYDYKTADKLLAVAENLVNVYSGRLTAIHEAASDPRDLELKLKELGKGVGDATVRIFLRELRGLWTKADPYPTALEILAGKQLGILRKTTDDDKTLEKLKFFWTTHKVSGKSFLHFETALVRLGKQYRKELCHT